LSVGQDRGGSDAARGRGGRLILASVPGSLPDSGRRRGARSLAQRALGFIGWRRGRIDAAADPEAKLTALAAEMTAAYVANHDVALGEIPALLRRFRAELVELHPVAEAAATPEAAAPAAPARRLAPGWFALDRAAVLLVGVGVGAMIGWTFASDAARAPAAAPAATVVASVAPAKAAAPLDCPTPVPPHLLQTLAAGKPVTVGVFGDSFGVGVWAALRQMLPKDYKVLEFAKESTGFTRYASLNLEDNARGQIAGQPIDIAVIDFGANDTQGLYDGPHAYPLLSDGWKAAYGARIDRYVTLLRQQGAMVYWVGLPKMRKPDYDRQIADMEAFYDARMTALGVPYIGVAPLSVDASGAFNEYLPDGPSQKPRLMRANDGIHMSFAGYERISTPVAQRIEDYVARARKMAMIDAPPASPGPPAPRSRAS
jgi:hypothetical protein